MSTCSSSATAKRHNGGMGKCYDTPRASVIISFVVAFIQDGVQNMRNESTRHDISYDTIMNSTYL
jgi:hypothetical protein